MADDGDNSGTDEDGDVEDADAQRLLADAVDGGDGDGTDTDDTETQIATLKAELDKWKALARKHETRSRENAAAAGKAKTVEQQIAALQQQMADRDALDVERNGKLAMAQVHSGLAEAGVKKDDVSGVLELVSAAQLLTDGEPNAAAIKKLVDSLVRAAGQVRPDPDQGRKTKDTGGPVNMNDFIRQQAGITR